MDFGAVPSIYPEPFGIVRLEYIACGLPVIASNVGGIPEVAVDGKMGFLVKPNNPQALSAAIESILNNPDLSMEMGKAARENMSNKILHGESMLISF